MSLCHMDTKKTREQAIQLHKEMEYRGVSMEDRTAAAMITLLSKQQHTTSRLFIRRLLL